MAEDFDPNELQTVIDAALSTCAPGRWPKELDP